MEHKMQSTIFRGPYYSRRRSAIRQMKPLIRKLVGVDTWMCYWRDMRPQVPGFGITPSDAYRNWKSKQC
jgi:hypothetical protein